MKKLSNNIFLIMLVIVVLFLPYFASARPEYAVRESRNCPFCHTRDGPPQLNEIGVYYGTNNHSMEGFVPSPKVSPTPEPTKEIEIGVHMNTWDVGIKAFVTLLLILMVVYIIRL